MQSVNAMKHKIFLIKSKNQIEKKINIDQYFV